ncbi:WW domain-binding protein 11 isoform X2 [Pieris napi]|uniref:WW domain-binding protein 11 isoform X2 n=1 Tax=Pieris napi TaxID=78633 RepID=UPI001FB9CE27|nr:WW domain-binding protein 11 isoform X2 [Pieris napi]
MGRRSINTTKSGKYMNPTDQARKEARKKELKKNKRQRQMVRAAVLKMKDPTQILDELQKIDEMEYNVLQPSPLNEKVLKEKRKKLKETFDRVLKMYYKDDPEKWVDLKRQEVEYEKRRAHLISYYESVKHAQSVQVDDIPLPTLQVPDNLIYGNLPLQIPLPADTLHPSVPMKPILKKDSAYKERPAGVEPPGVPPGPPPDYGLLLAEAVKLSISEKKTIRFSDIADDGPPGINVNSSVSKIKKGECCQNLDASNDEAMDEDSPPSPIPPGVQNGSIADAPGAPGVPGAPGAAAAPKPTSLQQRMLALSGQNIDDFMKEMEEVHRKRERDRAADLNARLSALKRTKAGRDSDSDSEPENSVDVEPPGLEVRPMIPPPLMPGLRPPMLRVPPGAPPGVPPGVPPAPPGLPLVMPPGPPPGLPGRPLRPPGPPPGAPPRLMRPLVPPPPHVSVLTAAPQLIQKKDAPQSATISAKPQIRNLSADVTRFVPSALRVKREDKRTKTELKATIHRTEMPKQVPTKDDAYMQFMKEMEGLL